MPIEVLRQLVAVFHAPQIARKKPYHSTANVFLKSLSKTSVFVSSISGPIEVGGGRTYFCPQIRITNQWLKNQDILFLPSPASAVYFRIPGDYKEIARDEVTSTCGLGLALGLLSCLDCLISIKMVLMAKKRGYTWRKSCLTLT